MPLLYKINPTGRKMGAQKEQALSELLRLEKAHYENFPKASILIPKKMRTDVAILYCFARTADDLADDEGIPPIERLFNLENYEKSFRDCLDSVYKSEFWKALHLSILRNNLPVQEFLNLLKAFKQDQLVTSYPTRGLLLEYCSCSANPVGRLMLQLFGVSDPRAVYCSDLICSALQLTNFIQDLSMDLLQGRCYFPAEDLEKFNIDHNQIDSNSRDFIEFMKYETGFVKEMFLEGRGLLGFLKGRLRLDIHMTILGGMRILKKIEDADYDVINKRPVLTGPDFFLMALKSIG